MTAPFTVDQTLRHGMRELASHSNSPRLDAEILLAQVLHLPRSGLIVHGHDPLPLAARRDYETLLTRRRDGTPVAYLTGVREFWSLPLRVTPAVLVPRPETETLVEATLERLPPSEPSSLLDLGTGSGAIALAIASERPQCRIAAVDLSPQALDVARHNAASLGIATINWHHGSWFDALSGEATAPRERFDVIVSNPPYIAASDPALAALGAEPLLALTPGPTGYEALDTIVASAPAYLRRGGWLLLEHGDTQAQHVAERLSRGGFIHIQSLTDAAGRPRVTLGSVQPQEKDCT